MKPPLLIFDDITVVIVNIKDLPVRTRNTVEDVK